MSAPADLAYPEKLPDDLRLLLTEQKVPVDDPLIALLAWHWERVAKGQDTFDEGIIALKVALDSRLAKITGVEKAWIEVAQYLEGLKHILKPEPSILAEQIEKEVAGAVAQVKSLQGLLKGAEGSLRKLRRERMVATFLSGFSVGGMAVLWIGLHYFSRS